jgi:hypothetical protein
MSSLKRSVRAQIHKHKLLDSLYKFYKFNPLRVVRWSPHQNIFHCCTQKTASQWLRGVFQDPVFFTHTGLKMLPYVSLGLRYAEFQRPFPRRRIVTHLYISHSTYQQIPKPDRFKTFFMMRDPRDLVVSWYFSAKFSHKPMGPIPELREALSGLEKGEGLRFMIDRLADWESFDAQRSWMRQSEDRDRIRVFRFEDLAADERSFLVNLFEYLDVEIPADQFESFYHRHRFETITQGRDKGTVDVQSNFRKGVPGDWKNHFDEQTLDHFKKITGNLIDELGYAE